MKPGGYILVIGLFSMIPALQCRASSVDGDLQTSHQLSLADLAGYRAALSGKPTADLARASDPPVHTNFKDLWNRPDVFRGRRVTVQGHVARIFRQGPVGSFPALAEVWITSPAGDPFCVVFPQPGSPEQGLSGSRAIAGGDGLVLEENRPDGERAAFVPELGRTVRFTGTFLKLVRYAGGDGARVAPLIVGDRLPVAVATKAASSHLSEGTGAPGDLADSPSSAALGTAFWAIGLAALAALAVIVARWHLGVPPPLATRRRMMAQSTPDPPLEFIDPREDA
jgi:hypothetical protein